MWRRETVVLPSGVVTLQRMVRLESLARSHDRRANAGRAEVVWSRSVDELEKGRREA